MEVIRSKTISIHLVGGNPSGIKITEISNRIIRCYEVPRILLGELSGKTELDKPALYFLFDNEGGRVYIGKTTHFYGRVKEHNRDEEKVFWDKSIAFFAKDSSLDPGDIDYLEYQAIKEAKAVDRVNVINAGGRVKSDIHQFRQDAIEDFFDDAKIILSTLGYKLFEKPTINSKTDIWYCNAKNTQAKGIYDEKGFVVLKDSIIDGSLRESFKEDRFQHIIDNRINTLNSKAEQIDKNTFKLKENVFFDSLNKASIFCVGGSVNAWTLWKNNEGKTMDEIVRKSL